MDGLVAMMDSSSGKMGREVSYSIQMCEIAQSRCTWIGSRWATRDMG